MRGSTLFAVAAAAFLLAGGSAASTRPAVAITAAPAHTTDKTGATFRWRTARPSIRTLCRLSRETAGTAILGQLRPCVSPLRLRALAFGRHTLALVAVEHGRRVGRVVYGWSITRAAVSPLPTPPPAPAAPSPPGSLNLSFTSTPPLNSTSVSATFAWSLNDPAATTSCSADNGVSFPCSSPTTVVVGSGGSHRFDVRAADGAAAAAITYSWTITPSPPSSSESCAVAPFHFLAPVHPEITTAEQHFVDLVNQARAGLGLAALTINPYLNIAADSHSYWQDVALGNGLSHTGCNGSLPWDRVADTGYRASASGEVTLIRNPPATADVAFAMFKGSPGHWALLTSPTFTAIGVGASTNHWTGDLARP